MRKSYANVFTFIGIYGIIILIWINIKEINMGGAIAGAAIDILIGIVFIVIGILNIKGNVSMLHSYHINNISEENKKPFGKLVGIGMIVIAVALMIAGALYIPAELTRESIYATASNVVLFAGLIAGCGISLYAIKKYNKNIFG